MQSPRWLLVGPLPLASACQQEASLAPTAPPDRPAALASVSATAPDFLRPATGSPSIANPVVRFYAVRGASREGLAECYHNIAITHRDRRDLKRAHECELRAIEFARESGSTRLVALARLGRDEILLRQGKLIEAHQMLEAALAILRLHGAALNEAETLHALAECEAARGNITEALAAAHLAIEKFAAFDALEDVGDVGDLVKRLEQRREA